jgi:hypothetical protein
MYSPSFHMMLSIFQLNANVNTWRIVDEEATVSDTYFEVALIVFIKHIFLGASFERTVALSRSALQLSGGDRW